MTLTWSSAARACSRSSRIIFSGVRADEEKNFTVNYPEDFTSKGLAGKKVEYTANVTAVRRKELPEMDDEWAKSLGEEFESLESLREKVREDLTKRAGVESDNRLRSEVMQKLVEAHPFEVPETLVEHQAQQLLESVVRDMIGRGIDPRAAGDQLGRRARAVEDSGRRRCARLDAAGAHRRRRKRSRSREEEIEAEINPIAASVASNAGASACCLDKAGRRT